MHNLAIFFFLYIDTKRQHDILSVSCKIYCVQADWSLTMNSLFYLDDRRLVQFVIKY